MQSHVHQSAIFRRTVRLRCDGGSFACVKRPPCGVVALVFSGLAVPRNVGTLLILFIAPRWADSLAGALPNEVPPLAERA